MKMTVDQFLKQGGDLLKFIRQSTPEEGQKMTVALYAEGVKAAYDNFAALSPTKTTATA